MGQEKQAASSGVLQCGYRGSRAAAVSGLCAGLPAGQGEALSREVWRGRWQRAGRGGHGALSAPGDFTSSSAAPKGRRGCQVLNCVLSNSSPILAACSCSHPRIRNKNVWREAGSALGSADPSLSSALTDGLTPNTAELWLITDTQAFLSQSFSSPCTPRRRKEGSGAADERVFVPLRAGRGGIVGRLCPPGSRRRRICSCIRNRHPEGV